MAVIVPASTRQKTVGIGMVAASLAYLTHFVGRGWLAHDEGMLAQAAERVLLGDVPHVSYEEPYTGGLSWIYAAIFRVTGSELLHIRWLLFAVAAVAVALLYVLLRRFLKPAGAGIATWVGLAWSFPNYFAGLPSWWLLTCALASTWAMVRYVESRELRYGVLAGAAAGIAITIKQTGIYLLVALLLTLAYMQTVSSPRSRFPLLFARAAGSVAALFAAAIIASRMFAAEGLYLFCPIAACSAVLLLRRDTSDAPVGHTATNLRLWIALCAAALVPVAVLLFPYVLHNRLPEFVYGAFVLPRKRLTYASYSMPPALMIVTGMSLIGLVVPVPQFMFGARSRFLDVLLWAAAVTLPVCAVWNFTIYQLIWQSTRAFAVLVPLAICYGLVRGRIENVSQASVLYLAAAVLAWMSLNQFPYASPIYFSYVTPLAVVAAVALAAATGSLGRHLTVPWALMILLFAILTTHRSYVEQLGVEYVPRHFDTPLNLPRAHLWLEPGEATGYRRTVALIEQHLRGGRLVAGPDTPELYYLTGTQSESGRLFDFFSDSESGSGAAIEEWSSGQVIVVNHQPAFSRPPAPELIAQLRQTFPGGEQVGRFEVRWR
jgi:hypothetical protein